MADRQNQAGLLGQRDKSVWRNQRAPWAQPADERFGTDDPAVVRGLQLVVEHELVSCQRLAQVRFHGHAFRDDGLHLRVKKAQCIAPGLLGLIHGDVGLFQQLLFAFRVIAEQGGADAGGIVVFVCAKLVGLVERGQNLLADHLDLCRANQDVRAQVLEHYHELIPANTGNRVFLAHARHEALRDLKQQQVADIMAEVVVQILEIVQVDEKKSASLMLTGSRCKCLVDPIQQQPAIGQMSKVVIERQTLDFFRRRPLQGIVIDCGNKIGDDALIVFHRAERELLRKILAILARGPDFARPEARRIDVFPHCRTGFWLLTLGLKHTKIPANGFFGAESCDIGEGLIHLQYHPLSIRDHHAFLGFKGDGGNA